MMYCPKCGFTIYKPKIKTPTPKQCPYCNTVIIDALHNNEYYEQKAQEQYSDGDLDEKVLFNEEIKKHPLFDYEAYRQREDEIDRRLENIVYSNRQLNNAHQPKCPMCGSTNIHKISGVKRATHGLAFGLFSKTARSQWECGNCHNKW